MATDFRRLPLTKRVAKVAVAAAKAAPAVASAKAVPAVASAKVAVRLAAYDSAAHPKPT